MHRKRDCVPIFFLVLVLSSSLWGCGKAPQPDIAEPWVSVTDAWEPVSVLESTWKGFAEVKEALEPWHTESYNDGFGILPDGESYLFEPEYAWSGDSLYSLSYCYEQDGDGNLFFFRLSEINTVTMKETSLRFSPSDLHFPAEDEGRPAMDEPAWGELNDSVRKGKAQLASLDVLGDRICFSCILYEVSNEREWKIAHDYCFEIDRDLHVQNLTDLAEQLFGTQRTGQTSFPRKYFTQEGEICVICDSEKQMKVYSWDGARKDCLDLDGMIGDLPTILVGHGDDGTPIFQAADSHKRIRYFTPRKLLYQGEGYLPLSCLDGEGGMLLWKDGDLVRWNVESGEAARLCSLMGLSWSSCKGVRKNTAGRIVLAYDAGDGLCLYGYDIGAGRERVLRIAGAMEYQTMNECIADYQRTHPGIVIEYTLYDSPYQNPMVFNLMAADCKKENAPDLFLFSEKEQMDILQAAGCLAPVDEMLPDETKDGLFDCVLDLGRTEDGFYGIAFQADLVCYLVSTAVWEQDSWTIQQLMDCYKSAKGEESGYERLLPSGVHSQMLLYDLFLTNIEDTPFIDFENGECHFDYEEFKELLTFCRECADPSPADIAIKDTAEQVEEVRAGEALLLPSLGGLSQYSKSRAALGSGYISVGVPSESGRGFVARAYNLLSVNAFSENQDLAADFLAYLLSERCQVRFGNGRWVRKDVIQTHTEEHHINWKGETECVFRMDNGGMPLAVDENGDSFVREYIEIMDKARAYSAHGDISRIISEEADAYFQNGKTVDEVVRVIQSRVQLYLQEAAP